MKTDTFLYLASPYYHKTRKMRALRAKAAARVTGHLMKNNVCVFSPIVHNHQLKVQGHLKDWTHEDYMAYDAAFMEAASGLMVVKLPGWEISRGVTQEIKDFENQKKPVFKYDPRHLFTTQEWTDMKPFACGGIIVKPRTEIKI